jgi:hypothetical protein
VLVGQFTMAKSATSLEDAIRAALAVPVPPREVLEIILQCVIYGGTPSTWTGRPPRWRSWADGRARANCVRRLQKDAKADEERAKAPETPELRREKRWPSTSRVAVTGQARPKHHLNIPDYFRSDRLLHFADIG